MSQAKVYLIGIGLLIGAVLLSYRFKETPVATEKLFPQKTLDSLIILPQIADVETGYATFYSSPEHGRKTASGEIYDSLGWTAAHKTLPFGTKVLVYNIRTGYWLVTRINDRLPKIKEYHDRVIDLSVSCNNAIGGSGKEKVILMVLKAE